MTTARRTSTTTKSANTTSPANAKATPPHLDWDINANHKLTFKGIFNNRNDWENRYRTTLKDLDPDGNATVRIQTKAGTPDNRNRLERQRTMDFALGGEHLFGALSMDWHASYAKANEERSQRTLHRLPTEETEVRHGPERRTPTLCQPQNGLYHDIER